MVLPQRVELRKTGGSGDRAPVAAQCPRCGGPLRCGGVLEPALSRFDNMTKVCSDCGTDEALFERDWGNVPDFRYLLVGGVAHEKGGL
jgi:hypothetical protein